MYNGEFRSNLDNSNIYILSNPKSIKHLNTFMLQLYIIENYKKSPELFKFVDEIEDLDQKIMAKWN